MSSKAVTHADRGSKSTLVSRSQRLQMQKRRRRKQMAVGTGVCLLLAAIWFVIPDGSALSTEPLIELSPSATSSTLVKAPFLDANDNEVRIEDVSDRPFKLVLFVRSVDSVQSLQDNSNCQVCMAQSIVLEKMEPFLASLGVQPIIIVPTAIRTPFIAKLFAEQAGVAHESQLTVPMLTDDKSLAASQLGLNNPWGGSRRGLFLLDDSNNLLLTRVWSSKTQFVGEAEITRMLKDVVDGTIEGDLPRSNDES